MSVHFNTRYSRVVEEISGLSWRGLPRRELMAACHAYYYFSIQFREALEVACELFPSDGKLAELRKGECGTDNLSPYPLVAEDGEKMNHDEFMRRVLGLSSLDQAAKDRVETLGRLYLEETRQAEPLVKAKSLASYEDGGLEKVFRAILLAPDWDETSLGAFRHFLAEHIRLDSSPDAGHGSLCRHLVPDDSVFPLWNAFLNMLVKAAPALRNPA